jgi:hypothetical protein
MQATVKVLSLFLLLILAACSEPKICSNEMQLGGKNGNSHLVANEYIVILADDYALALLTQAWNDISPTLEWIGPKENRLVKVVTTTKSADYVLKLLGSDTRVQSVQANAVVKKFGNTKANGC